jgi:large conductance mechanosensitive channel
VIKEFKEFLNQGNVIDLAVAVIIGVAFGLVIKSFTEDILMQIVGAIFGKPDFNSLTFTINDSVIRYGSFINAVINFVIIAFALFLVIKLLTAAQRKKVEEPAGPTETELLTEIRDALKARN